MKDQLPKKPRLVECGIVNLDDSVNEGTHWVAFIKLYDYCEYFDSYGDLKPPLELVKYLKTYNILYNYTRFQKNNTVICGHLCLEYLINFWSKYNV